MRVLAVCIGKAEPIASKSGVSGIFKRPAAGPVEVTPEGLTGDVIVDTRNHGGPDQAVYLMPEADRVWWAETLGRDLEPGYFGENLLADCPGSAELCIGDILETDTVRMQVTAPRIPCATFAARVGSPQAVKAFYASGRPGAYLRVLSPGPVATGDGLRHLPYHGDRISVVEMMRGYVGNYSDDEFLRRLAATPVHHKLAEMAAERFSP